MFFGKDASGYKFVHLYGGPLDGKIVPIQLDGFSMTVTIGVNTPEDIEDGFGDPNQPTRLEKLTYEPHTAEDVINHIWRLVEPTIKEPPHDPPQN